MSLELSIAPYRLLFKHPFGTAHGMRDGTDSVFIRLERNGVAGYGEATLPPYVSERPEEVIAQLERIDRHALVQGQFALDGTVYPATRAAISTAYYDLVSRQKGRSIGKMLQVPANAVPGSISLMTIGLTEHKDIGSKLNEMEPFNGLKVKLNGISDEVILNEVMKHDGRPILLDANQAWTSVEHALKVIDLVGSIRLIGLEQPFPVGRADLQEELNKRTKVIIYGDESIREMNDLKLAARIFTGVNLKLMKCGGIDRAAEMARQAHELGMKVMLGSMSESSLGCGAMLQLAPWADVIDLDGPWLISNDPFTGMVLEDGSPKVEGLLGTGIQERSPSHLNWTPIGA